METIKIGDRVEINWENIQAIYGTVIYIPMSQSDCWHIKGDDEILYYIQCFCVMIKK